MGKAKSDPAVAGTDGLERWTARSLIPLAKIKNLRSLLLNHLDLLIEKLACQAINGQMNPETLLSLD
jgi:hypothetical protein